MRLGRGKKGRWGGSLALALLAAGCGAHWPWHRTPPPPEPAVHELEIGAAGGESFPQYWKRNTLLIDLSAARGSGSITLRPAAGSWPVRLAFRVTPGAIGRLEIRAAQRLVLPISGAGGKPVDLELAPGMYTSATTQMTVSWGPADASAPAGQSTPMS